MNNNDNKLKKSKVDSKLGLNKDSLYNAGAKMTFPIKNKGENIKVEREHNHETNPKSDNDG